MRPRLTKASQGQHGPQEPQTGRPSMPHPRIPLVEGLDVDEGHFPVGSSHDAVMLTTDNKVNVVSKLPPAVPAANTELVWSPETSDFREAAQPRWLTYR